MPRNVPEKLKALFSCLKVSFSPAFFHSFAPALSNTVSTTISTFFFVMSMPNMSGRLGCRTMEMNGGSSASYLARTPCRRAFRLPGEGGDHVHCTVEPSPGHIRCRIFRNEKAAQRVSFGAGYPSNVHADIPADVRAQKLRSGPRNPGKTRISVQTSMTRRRGRP